MRRVAQLGDGWLPGFRTAEAAQGHLDALDRHLDANGRSRSDIGLEARLHWGTGDLEALGRSLEGWQSAGATHISLNTMGAGLATPQQHLAAIRRFAEVFHLAGPS